MKINLEKRKEHVGIILDKRQIPHVTSQVKFAVDISGSMSALYPATVQDVIERCLAIASRFDDNGEMEVFTFHNVSTELSPISENMKYQTYVKREILDNPNCSKWGGTSYAPVMQDIINASFGPSTKVEQVAAKATGFLKKVGGLFGKAPANVAPAQAATAPVQKSSDPVFVIFITDGENDDKEATRRIISDNMDKNIYWMFVGIGGYSFPFIRQLGEQFPNVGFEAFSDIESADDADFYEKILNPEFCAWVKNFNLQQA